MTESPHPVALENILIGLNALTDLVEDLRTQLGKLMEPEGVPETLVCETCDAGMGLTIAEALQEGWENIQFAPDLMQANYCGTCKSCLDAEDAEVEARKQVEPQPKPKTLFSLEP